MTSPPDPDVDHIDDATDIAWLKERRRVLANRRADHEPRTRNTDPKEQQ